MVTTVDFPVYQEVLRLLRECDRAHDERLSETWLDLFTAEARYVVHGRAYVGRSELARFLAERRDGAGKHLHGTPVVQRLNDDELSCECDYVGFRRCPGAIVVGGTGRYRDRLRFVAGRWRFSERLVEGALLGDQFIHEPRTAATATAID